METTAISVKHLTVSYGEAPVLKNVNVEVAKGELTAIVGPNGAGKSTLIKAIMKLIRPSSGEITILGSKSKEALKQIAYIPQKGEVNWDFPTTVLDVVMMGRYVHKGWIKRPDKHDRSIALEALETMQMTPYKHRQITELSGGQRQRVFLARAIAHDADVYIMDEPLQGIDMKTESLIIDTMKRLKNEGKTFLVVHHNLVTVPEYFDKAIILNKELISSGNIEDVWHQENIDLAYYDRV